MEEKKRTRKVIFGIAFRMTIGIILIAAVLTAASVYIGAKIYWDDITDHYNTVARHTAQAVENVFGLTSKSLPAGAISRTGMPTGRQPTRKLLPLPKASVTASSNISMRTSM